MKKLLGRLLDWPEELALFAPFWPLCGALLCKWLRLWKLEARCVGVAIARSIDLAREFNRD